MNIATKILFLAALAATSCSLQLDSQYGLRWDRRVPAQRQHEAGAERTEDIAATKVTDELLTTSDWSEANIAQIDEVQSADQIQMIAARPEFANEAFTVEAQWANNDLETSATNYSIDDFQHVPSEKDVLTKFGGIILLLLGIGLLWLSFFAIVVMGAYGASFGGVLFAILITAVGVLLIVVGRRLIRGY